MIQLLFGFLAKVGGRHDKVVLRDNQKNEETDVKKFQVFRGDESGATAIEYALVAALIAIVIIGALTNVGTNLVNIFNNIAGFLL